MCRECRVNRTNQQKRGYANDDSVVRFDQSLFPPRDANASEEKSYRRVSWPNTSKTQLTQQDRWGRKKDDSEVRSIIAEDDDDATGDSATATEEGWSNRDSDRTAKHEFTQDALWERFEQVEEDATKEVTGDFAVDPTAETFALHAERDLSLLDIDYATILPQALERRETDMTARCLFAASRANDLDFIRSIDEATFSTVLNVMKPANSIDTLASAHLEISAAMARQLGVASMHKVAYEYSSVLSEIVAIRRSAGIKLTLGDYAVLLKSARDLGNNTVARTLWNKMQIDGMEPDIECWNHYLANVVFSKLHSAGSRFQSRVIPFHMMARRAARPGTQFFNYRTGVGGVKDKVLGAFGHMLRSGVIANEESFRVVITAAAREGEVATVKSVLRKVWGIDVDAIRSGQDEAEMTAKELPRTSPLYPTTKLLFTLAHAFGINNDVPTALRLVDFVARRYDLTIDHATWAQLFEWTFVLSSVRSGARSKIDQIRTGQLPLQSVMSLWETMTGPPYFIRPTMGMYNRLVKNLFYRDMSPTVVEKMEEGRQLYVQSIEHAYKLWRQLRDDLVLAERNPTLVDSLEKLRSEWETADLFRKRNLFWCKRWLRLLLATLRSSIHFDPLSSGDLSLRQIPRLLWEWRDFAPTHVSYETLGGIVEFEIRTQEEIDANAVKRARFRARQQELLDRVPRYVGHLWLRQEPSARGLLPRRMGVLEGEGRDRFMMSDRQSRANEFVVDEQEAQAVEMKNTIRREVDGALDRR